MVEINKKVSYKKSSQRNPAATGLFFWSLVIGHWSLVISHWALGGRFGDMMRYKNMVEI
jgi:hypothetical protein